MELLTNKCKEMKKLYTLLLMFTTCLLAGCDENGESGYYEDIDRVYFLEDSIVCRLGEMLMDVEIYTVKVPVKVLGAPFDENRVFRVNVNKELTTAPEDIYTSLSTEFVVDKDSVNAYIPIELLRNKIDPMVDTVYRIVLDLEENDKFGLGVQEKLQSKVVFSNYLQEPDWWYALEFMYWGDYRPEKYQKMMEYWGGPISFEEYTSRMVQVILCGKKMYDYFKLHPEFGMEFPETAPWPYE